MTPKTGDTVKIHYRGILADGTVFGTSGDGDPLTVVLGAGTIPKRFEQEILAMKVGQKNTFKISPDEAYGPHRAELVMELPRSDMPVGVVPKVNQHIQIGGAKGEKFSVKVVALTETTITLDANHPLAGKELSFEVELLNISAGDGY